MPLVDETDIKRITQAIDGLLKGRDVGEVELPACHQDDEFGQLVRGVNRLISESRALADFVAATSRGDLDYPAPPGRLKANQLLKSLQSHLRHLTWKTRAIADGDFTQRVDFLGEFSASFNSMTEQLAESRAELTRRNEALSRLSAELEARVLQRTEALLASEARYRRIADNMRDLVSQIDTGGVYVYASPSHRAVVGFEPEQIVGRPFTDFVHPDDVEKAELAVTASGRGAGAKTSREVQLRFRHADGHYLWVETVANPLLDERGRVVGTLVASRDISERRHLEEQLLRAQRLETAGRIASQVAHDFNNLLTPLAAYPELIKESLGYDHPVAPLCDILMDAATQMAEINEEMMALGHRGHVERTTLDLNGLVGKTLAQLPPFPATMTLQIELAAELLPVAGSRSQLQRVVANLVTNARDAMGARGVLGVRTENLYVDEPIVRRVRIEVGEYVKLTVSDTGGGIPSEIRDRIFDPFFTTKSRSENRGCGLGLAIVQGIVADHRGSIEVRSEVGVGTAMSVYLPVCRQAIVDEPAGELRGGTERILVVDDDHLQREAACLLLAPLGYRVVTVGSGEEAVEYLRSQSTDLLILDMVMPSGIDGAETFRRAREVRPGLRAIVASGYAETEQVREAQSLGVGSYLRKPLSRERLARAIREELERDGGAP